MLENVSNLTDEVFGLDAFKNSRGPKYACAYYLSVETFSNGNFFLILFNIGTLDEHMHLLLPALIRLFKVDAPVDIRRAAIKTLTRLIPRVQVGVQTLFNLKII